MARSRIHIAAEQRDLNMSLAGALRQRGYDVDLSTSAYPVVEMLDDWPDLFVIDIELPGINGIEVCKWLRSHDSSRYIPVILVSGDAYLKVLAASAHPTDYFERPIAIHVLTKKITELLITENAVG